ncbi:CLUMA_CG009750, isoform A [Clunio marinus]|uniref:CLUMA_CG009750, isoform A n=1 Tax=Clunio marinus TaxID=568069 RepID=A0A1J1I811_9DIPT|nr:CLUMA_CG009750, isoform A [Clunio marinus]
MLSTQALSGRVNSNRETHEECRSKADVKQANLHASNGNAALTVELGASGRDTVVVGCHKQVMTSTVVEKKCSKAISTVFKATHFAYMKKPQSIDTHASDTARENNGNVVI